MPVVLSTAGVVDFGAAVPAVESPWVVVSGCVTSPLAFLVVAIVAVVPFADVTKGVGACVDGMAELALLEDGVVKVLWLALVISVDVSRNGEVIAILFGGVT